MRREPPPSFDHPLPVASTDGTVMVVEPADEGVHPGAQAGRHRQVVVLLLCLALLSALVTAVAAFRPDGDGGPDAARGQLGGRAVDTPWVLTHEDHFDTLDRSVWGVYDGPGNGETGPRSAANAFVRDGSLVLRTTPVDGVWKAAGVSSAPGGWSQTYGKYEVRLRFERGYGVRAVALLWPQSGLWPPEVDFFEVDAADIDRRKSFLTNHFRQSDGERGLRQQFVLSDFTRWHTVGVEWTPDALVFTLDGEEVARVTADIPDEPMWLGLQTAQGELRRGVVPDASVTPSVDLFVDWVRVYRYEPGA